MKNDIWKAKTENNKFGDDEISFITNATNDIKESIKRIELVALAEKDIDDFRAGLVNLVTNINSYIRDVDLKRYKRLR